jgi:hypothetical protein
MFSYPPCSVKETRVRSRWMRALNGTARRSRWRGALVLIPGVAALAGSLEAQTPVDTGLAAYIATIKAVDHHAHPMLPAVPGAPADTDFDALPLDDIPPFPLPWRLTLESPQWAAAARRVYGLRGADTGAAVAAARHRVMAAQGERFAAWALDRAGIEVMFANRITLGPGLPPPRFRWVAFADPLLFPLDTRGEAARTPDTQPLYPKEATLLRRYLSELGLDALPGTLDEYVTRVIAPTLARWHDAGAVAIKFEAAYLRSLDFANPDSAEAAGVYATYAAGGIPERDEYKELEDELFRLIAREAGRVGLAVHLHVFEGFGSYYDMDGSRPALLEPAFDDPSLRETSFVIVHGGWPFVGETEAMLSKPNVYADISMMDLALAPAEVAGVLRHWLERWPDKVMFGSDAFEGGDQQGWELGAAVASSTARRALGMALTAMLRDGEISRDRAQALARMVLRENASRWYHLELP